MDKLKPCPFCGSDKLKIESNSSKCRDRPTDIGGWVLYRHYIMSVRCNVCYARGCTVSGDVVIDTRRADLGLVGYTTVEKVEEKAAEAWNRRVNDAPVRHGSWLGEGDGYADGELVYDVWHCSECEYCIDDGTDDPERLPKYCPGCGALMDGGNDNG